MAANETLKNIIKGGLILGIIAVMAGASYYVFKGTAEIGVVKPLSISVGPSGIAGKGLVPKMAEGTTSASSFAATVYQSHVITATVSPSNASDQAIEWESSNTNFVTLAKAETASGDANTVQMIQPWSGSAVTITAYSHFDKSIKATCTVTNYNEAVSLTCKTAAITAAGYASGSDTMVTESWACGKNAPSSSETMTVSDGVGDEGQVDRASHFIKGIVSGATANAAGTGYNSHSLDFNFDFDLTALYPDIPFSCVSTSSLIFGTMETDSVFSGGTQYDAATTVAPGNEAGVFSVVWSENNSFSTQAAKPTAGITFYKASTGLAFHVKLGLTYSNKDQFSKWPSFTLNIGGIGQNWSVGSITEASAAGISETAIVF